jgi:hypothetical protein
MLGGHDYLIVFDKDHKLIYIDFKGNQLFPGKFVDADNFWGDWAYVVEDLGNNNYSHRFINKKGETVFQVPDIYEVVTYNDRYTDQEGAYAEVSYEYGKDLIIVNRKSDNKMGIIDKTGKIVFPFQDQKLLRLYHGNYIIAWDDYEELYYDANGNQIEAIYAEGMAPVQNSDGKWGYIAEPVPQTAATATPTTATVLVDGKPVSFDAYNINGNNFFKLRDIAMALTGSAKQFEVGWDAAANAISLTSGSAYTKVGGELAKGSPGSKQANPTTSKIFLDGEEINLTAYNIGGNNYFKLRDLGAAFDFGIGWDDATKTITIDTSTGYAE